MAEPVPESHAPCAPAWSAAAIAGTSAGMIPARTGWCSASSQAQRNAARLPVAMDVAKRAVRDRLKTASARETMGGSSARTAAVSLRACGTKMTACRPRGTGTALAHQRPPARTHTCMPPYSAAAVLSAWPSASATSCRAASTPAAGSVVPVRASAAKSPETSAAEEDPKPAPIGMRFTRRRPSGGSDAKPAAENPSSRPRTTRFVEGAPSREADSEGLHCCGSVAAPSPSICSDQLVTSVRTNSSFQRSRASPNASNPGPRFADDAGARTLTQRCSSC